MSWIFGNAKRGVPNAETDNRAAAREQQIINLQERVPRLEQKSSDSCLYEVEILAPPDGRKVTLRVFLPTKFPDERPVLQLLSPVTHPWVNTYQQVNGHPALEGWSGTSPPMIGDVVLEVISEFGRDASGGNSPRLARSVGSPSSIPAANPTVPFARQPIHRPYVQDVPRPTGVGVVGGANVASHQPTPSAGLRMNVSSSVPKSSRGPHSTSSYEGVGRQPHQTHQTQTPGVPTEFTKVKGMSTIQIDRLLKDDDARKALLMGEPSVIGMKEPCSAVWKDNVDAAQSTLLKQEEARALREEAEGLRAELRDLLTHYKGQETKSKTLAGGGNQAIVKRVKNAAREADTTSEQIAANFLEKRVPLQEFMDEFLRERQRYHTLAAKTECVMRERRS